MKYALINQATSICENIIIWDGDTAKWNPPNGYIAVEANSIKIGDECEQVDGVWQTVQQ